VCNPVHPQSVQARIAKQHFENAPRGRIPFEYSLDIFTEGAKHLRHLFRSVLSAFPSLRPRPVRAAD